MRGGMVEDLSEIKVLADSYKAELGFVNRAALSRSIDREEILVAVQRGKIVGFVDYHRRKDDQLTLYHIAVEPKTQRQGVGRALVDALQVVGRDAGCSRILLKCPTDLGANRFYQLYGFGLDETSNGRKRPLNVWVLWL